MNLFRAAIAPIARGAPFFRAIVVTGSHEASLDGGGRGQGGPCIDRLRELRAALNAAVPNSSNASPSSPRARSRLGCRSSPAQALASRSIAAVRKRCLPRLPIRTWTKRAPRLDLRALARLSQPTMIGVAEIERGAQAQGYGRLA